MFQVHADRLKLKFFALLAFFYYVVCPAIEIQENLNSWFISINNREAIQYFRISLFLYLKRNFEILIFSTWLHCMIHIVVAKQPWAMYWFRSFLSFITKNHFFEMLNIEDYGCIIFCYAICVIFWLFLPKAAQKAYPSQSGRQPK